MTNCGRAEKKKVLHVGSYEIGRTLGNGSFGKVKLATNVFTKEKVAIKFLKHKRFATPQQVENTRREIEIMKLLSHPNIVKLIDVIEKPEECTTYLIAEYVSGGELFDYIVANGVVKEKQARHFLRQIISAMEYCHANLVVHRDLKPENLLLDSNGNIKISDFGLSNMIEPGKLLDSFCGSPLYAAPEILRAERYIGPPVDVWSIGVILFALLCGHLPWGGESQCDITHNSIKGIYEEPMAVSPSGREILRKMLTPDPKERITIAEIRNHPWINEGYNESPASYLVIRQPVMEVRQDILAMLVPFGFKNDAELRKLILENHCCQAVAIYHLLLDRRVTEEMTELKKRMIISQPIAIPGNIKMPSSKSKLPSTSLRVSGSPVIMASKLTSIVEEPPEISAEDWHKILRSSEGLPERHHKDEVKASLPDSPPRPLAPFQPPLNNKDQLCNSKSSPGGKRHRRYSVSASDSMQHNMSLPQTYSEFDHQQKVRCLDQGEPQEPSASPHQNHPNGHPCSQNQYTPRRKFSLDSRAIEERKQTSQENGGGPCGPRQLKGVFKASTTTTLSPAEAAKLVKKSLFNTSYFVKCKSPYVFECLDEETNVKFQLEVCKIPQLNITGIHLQRLTGDIWQYKTMCTHVVNRLAL